MRRDPLVEPRAAGRLPDCVLEGGILDMVPPPDPGLRVHRELAGWKQPLPFPGLASDRVLPFQSLRQPDARQIVRAVLAIELAQTILVFAQCSHEGFRKNRRAIFTAFAASHGDHPA